MSTDKSRASFTEKLTPQARKWYATAIAGAVASDGVVDDEELEYLNIAIKFLDDVDDIYKLVQQTKARKVPALSQLRGVSRDMAFRMIVTLTKITIVDLELSKGEKEFISEACKKLGFNKRFYERLIAYADNCILIEMRKKKIEAMEKKLGKELNELLRFGYNQEVVYE